MPFEEKLLQLCYLRIQLAFFLFTFKVVLLTNFIVDNWKSVDMRAGAQTLVFGAAKILPESRWYWLIRQELVPVHLSSPVMIASQWKGFAFVQNPQNQQL